jgi:hypothetical protein
MDRDARTSREDLSELRDLVEASIPPGQCSQHPERAASLACARCGDFQCAECEAESRAGICSRCVAKSDAQASALGPRLMQALLALELTLLVWTIVGIPRDQGTLPFWFAALVGVLGLVPLTQRLHRAGEWTRSGVMTLLGMLGMVALHRVELVTGAISLAMASIMLHPATNVSRARAAKADES